MNTLLGIHAYGAQSLEHRAAAPLIKVRCSRMTLSGDRTGEPAGTGCGWI